MKSLYKFIYDSGKEFYIRARTRAKAIDKHCQDTGVSKAFVEEHCKIENLGRC